MSIQKITISVEIPDGWEATGEYRKGKKNEDWILNEWGQAVEVVTDTNWLYVILRKKWQWPFFVENRYLRCFGGTWYRTNNPDFSNFSMDGILWNEPPDKTAIYENPNWIDKSRKMHGI